MSTATAPTRLIFLPGVGGNPAFWRAASDAVALPAERVLPGWPWFGVAAAADMPAHTAGCMQDLVDAVTPHMDQPCALIAQSMGGVVAVLATLQRPEHLTHLVLVATSGGVPIDDLHPHDWRPDFMRTNPAFPAWMARERWDLTPQLASLRTPALLLWGDADPISPVAVGERLQSLLPRAQLHVLPGGAHDLAQTHAAAVAAHITRHLLAGGAPPPSPSPTPPLRGDAPAA
ncbi:alpha/beta hydrolase [Acidovorax sp. Leaf76]|uniref:alpha/beta fold hydrolase n=1 Tax=unclassified Acidovorax TaxID=2684926 RepID=UPI0006F7CC88|nr:MULTISPECIES: alpha/beta fold hydrolase [unclassified Acidovorax]KQO26452.1 alpha/beta hydrolase [Acidovorax sp. Leaf76]KQO40225.1 alpha/beta hydrolase [Acidovorax sp. Leaf84]KQS42365.1 alpha/beta hydrolase [Acidovorax sp. Leaf191]